MFLYYKLISTLSGTRTRTGILPNRFSCYTCFYTSKLTSTYTSKHPDLFLCAIVKPSSRTLRSFLLYIHPTGKVLEYISQFLQSRLFYYHIRNVATKNIRIELILKLDAYVLPSHSILFLTQVSPISQYFYYGILCLK